MPPISREGKLCMKHCLMGVIEYETLNIHSVSPGKNQQNSPNNRGY